MNYIDTTEFMEYNLEISDLLEELGLYKKHYAQIKKSVKSLLSRVITLPKENGFTMLQMLAKADFKYNSGTLTLKIHNDLKSYLLQLKSHFTSYQLENILKLKSVYSIRIYQMLKQYEKVKCRIFEIKDLREVLELNKKYKLYADFKKKVILQAQKELKEFTDIYFEFEEIKTGRKVTAIKFIIYSNVQSQTKSEILIETNQEIIFHEDLEKLLDLLPQELITQNIKTLLNNYLNAKDLLYCESNLKYCLNQRAKKEINNFSGYLKKALDENLGEELKLKVENESLKSSFKEKIKNMSEEEKLNLKVDYFKNLPKNYQNYIIETVFKTDRQYKLLDLESAIRVYSEFHFNISDILKIKGL